MLKLPLHFSIMSNRFWMPEKKIYLIPSELASGTAAKILPAQVLESLNIINHFLVENIRTARRFLSAAGINKPIEELTFELLDKKTTYDTLSAHLKGSEHTCIGVISEAGCPGIADPGAMAVQWAHKHNWRVIPLIGPSSILLALMGSGLNGQSFAFNGYLPIDKVKRKKALVHYEKISLQGNQSQIFIETPYRNNQLFQTILETCNRNTTLSVSCNLTAPDEFIYTGTINEWRKVKYDFHKKPCIFIINANYNDFN